MLPQYTPDSKKSKLCAFCGNPFPTVPSNYDQKTYCSKACMASAYRTTLKGEANPNYRNAGIQTCKMCLKEFRAYVPRIYCSAVCRDSDPETKERARVNGAVTRVNRCCKFCDAPIASNRKCCDQCLVEHRKPDPLCEICKGPIIRPNAKQLKYCEGCYTSGVWKKQPHYSTCSRCGVSVPVYHRKYCDACWGIEVRLHHRVDENQDDIVGAFRQMGAGVLDLSGVGKGCPDLLCSYHGILQLVEIKNPKYKSKLNKLQLEWHASWRGRTPVVVWTVDDVIKVLESMAKEAGTHWHGMTPVEVRSPEEALKVIGAIR